MSRSAALARAFAWLALLVACGDVEPTPRPEPAAQTPPVEPEPVSAGSEPARSLREPAVLPDARPSVDPSAVVPHVLSAKTKSGENTTIELAAPAGWEVFIPPTEPDPHGGKFTLKEALAGLAGNGTLVARIATQLGSLYCDLFEQEAPLAVANFVGLARGKRKFWDDAEKAWVARPYYAGTGFYRMSPNTIIQAGDHTHTGRGRIGYTYEQELSSGLKFDRPGRLGMTRRAGKRNAAQFFVVERPGPHLDGTQTLFGQCAPVTLVQRIARVPTSGPPEFLALTPVQIQSIEVKRLRGGAAAWMPQDADANAALPGVPPPGGAVRVDEPAGDQER